MNRTALAWLAFAFTFATTAFAQGGPQAVTPSGAVPVFVFAGQSNAVGVDTLDELRADQRAAQPNVLFYGPNETGNMWGALTPSSSSPNLVDGIGRRVGSFGPEISAGQDHFRCIGWSVRGGSEVGGWRDRSVRSVESSERRPVRQHGRPREPIDCRFADTAGTNRICRWLLLDAGRSDAQSDEFRDDYAANLKNFIAPCDVISTVRTCRSCSARSSTSTRPFRPHVVRAQQQAVADDDTVTDKAFILTDDLGHQDFIHFNGQAIYTLGQRFGAGYLSIVDPDHDGVVREIDNCPTRANADQSDTNGDGFGDACVSPTVFIHRLRILVQSDHR